MPSSTGVAAGALRDATVDCRLVVHECRACTVRRRLRKRAREQVAHLASVLGEPVVERHAVGLRASGSSLRRSVRSVTDLEAADGRPVFTLARLALDELAEVLLRAWPGGVEHVGVRDVVFTRGNSLEADVACDSLARGEQIDIGLDSNGDYIVFFATREVRHRETLGSMRQCRDEKNEYGQLN